MTKISMLCNFCIILLCLQQVQSHSKVQIQSEAVETESSENDSAIDHLRSAVESFFNIEFPFFKSESKSNETEEDLDANATDSKTFMEKETELLNQELNEEALMENFTEYLKLLKSQFETIQEQNKELKTNLDAIRRTAEEAVRVSLKTSLLQFNIHDNHLRCLRNCTLPKASCAEMETPQSGAFVFEIPKSNLKPFYAYCHKEKEGSSWTVIQRREDGSVNFNRDWHDYKLGFGDVYGEYWLGLERLHQLTNSRDYELKIYLEDYEHKINIFNYAKFVIASEDEGYMLTLEKPKGERNDVFSSFHSGLKFTTFDKKNDESFENCAQKFKGGWWYKNCYQCNLNGQYFSFSDRHTYGGIRFQEWLIRNESLKRVLMLIRPL